MQALDAATGELIWENQVGPNTIRGFGAVRNIAIYQRQGLHGDQRRRAWSRFDARTGKVAWDTADRRSAQRLHEFERSDRRAAAR